MPEITKKLLDFRKNLGLTQAKMAEKLGIPQTTWASYEVGKANPPLKILSKLNEMGFVVPGFSTGVVSDVITETDAQIKERGGLAASLPPDTDLPQVVEGDAPEIFRFIRGKTLPVTARKTDQDAMVLLPSYSQSAAAGSGQHETQLRELEGYVPVLLEMLGSSHPKDCGVVRVVGDSMTDMGLLDGDLAIFDRSRIDGDGVYVISIGSDVRIKHLEHRPIEKKIVISSENAKRYPNPEVISYEQAENLLRIHGKVICWMHRHPY